MLVCFAYYLEDRFHAVSIRSVPSNPSKLLFGIPQGSIFGPILFTLYTAPIGDIILAHALDVMLCADDTQLYLIEYHQV